MPDAPRLTALIIISDDARRSSLEKPLRRAGFKIRDATNGEDGLRLAMEAPDLILLDLHLPDMSGFEVRCHLKSHATTAAIPVLLLSNALLDSSEFVQIMERGDEAYLTYPVAEVELLSFVNTLIRGHQFQRQFRSFLEAAPDAVIISDEDGKIVRVNGQAERLFGHRREELIGTEIELLMPECFRDGHRGKRFDFMSNPIMRSMGPNLKLLGLRKDGSEFPVEITLSPIPDHEEILIACIVRDVTQRQKTEQALETAVAYADDIIATLREPFVVLDHELRVKTANLAFYETFHFTKEETANRPLYELGNSDWNIARLRTLLNEIFSLNHSVQNFEVEHNFPTIGRKTMLLNARRFPLQSNNTELILLAIEDITERKQAEAVLNDSEIRYRRLFEAAKDGILILDTHTGRITDANPFMNELLGYSHEHFLGKELWELGLFSDKAANEAAVRTLQTSGYIRYEHMPLETSNGQRVEVEVVANAYHEDHHKVIQCNIRDITERSRLEAERNRLEIQMQEQAVALEDLHRRKDEFLAMLSHELRNPLSPIASALQLLGLQKNEDQLQQKARTIIERQVGQLTRLIDDLLEVSRITTGRIHLQQESIALNTIVEHAVETVRPLMVRHQHALTVSLSTEPIWLFADAARLEQVVVNLLTNAAKFTHDSGQIWLGVQQEGDECVLRVRDNGIGIAPETLPHVFDLFTQAEKSLDRSQGGLGIGLALVQRIVEMHKGHVGAFSTVGAGTEFIVHLPVMTTSANQPSLLENETSKTNEHSLRVMVVDDNEDAAQMLGMLLLKSGHEVLTVHDGPSTLTAAQEFCPNVVLLDIGLPGMNGFEVAKKMREQASFKDVVLVAMTGYGQDSDRQRSKEAGFDHHLVKPPDFKKLQRILETVSEKTF